jgi:3-dehydroquinate dehydratase/shikimate dehydrogenase
MVLISTIKTKRLILRPWKESDLEPFARLNADPRVMECFPAPLSRQESDALALRIQTKMNEQGWGFWAVEAPGVADFIGMIGLAHVLWEAHEVHFTPAIEIGWRLLHEYWGKGYATEGAKAALEFGFQTLKCDEIVAFTAVANARSRHVMEKLGMHTDPKDDFDHPKVPEGHPLRRQVLYRLKVGHL